ncbi:MAG: adenylosuccinate lyase [Proteobacteria bacterium]|nr:adenylosuccinate lyase [Pseudomonadota bacterium]MBU4129627.1 adenylosuccinate lyase [Pseudomonadota bacterium]
MKTIKAITALDGRYAGLTHELADIFSEFGLIRHRVQVEVEWLKFIITDLKLVPMNGLDLKPIDDIFTKFDCNDAEQVKIIEKKTNHDVKAVEYFIKDKLDTAGLAHIREWVHFACTSDDINNTAYALMLKKGKDMAADLLNQCIEKLEEKALVHKSIPMMSRTHGQPATPTTVGKEFVNFAWRIRQESLFLEGKQIQAKMNGATGNYNAHWFVFPEIDWIGASERFITRHLNLEPILYTTQINPNSSLSQVLHSLVRAAAILIDFDRDMWGYISLGYFKQRIKEGETGSSTMPHKVNPIDFENSEGNMGLAISMMEHLAVKLQKSRFQRDLSDSTVLRNLGSVFAYFSIGVKNTLKGLSKLDLNAQVIAADLENNQELLAEPFQTAMRVFGEENPYERLKDLTRGHKIGKTELQAFVDGLEKVPPAFKARMGQLTPATYVGLAEKLVDVYFNTKK